MMQIQNFGDLMLFMSPFLGVAFLCFIGFWPAGKAEGQRELYQECDPFLRTNQTIYSRLEELTEESELLEEELDIQTKRNQALMLLLHKFALGAFTEQEMRDLARDNVKGFPLTITEVHKSMLSREA